MKMDKEKNKKVSMKNVDEAVSVGCNDLRCPIHGTLSVRGRRFKGNVVKVIGKNVTIEFERFVFVQKYERYAKARTRLRAHIPACLLSALKVGDYAEIGECRPLSKTIHHVLVDIEKKSNNTANIEKSN